MMQTWQAKLKELIKKNKTSQEEVAEKIGVSQTAVGKWINGRRQPTFSHLEALSKLFNMSTKEFLFGNHDEKSSLTDTHKIPILYWQDLSKNTYLSKSSISTLLKNRYQQEEVIIMDYKVGDIKGNMVSALNSENIDAMQPPHYHELAISKKEWLIIDFNEKVKNEDIVLAKIDTGFVIRQYIEEGGKVILKALNPQYPIIENFEIWGVIVTSFKRYRFL